jgi:hypothetical protein
MVAIFAVMLLINEFQSVVLLKVTDQRLAL